MKTLKYGALVIGMLLLSGQLWAQASFPFHHYVHEKVRDTTIRNFMIKKYEGKATASDLEAIEEYLKATKEKTDSIKGESDAQLGEGAEPHIVIHPTDPNILAISYMSEVSFPVFISTDAGASWTQSTFDSEAALYQLFPDDFIFGFGDPILAFAKDGTLYFTYIYLHGNFDSFLGSMLFVYSNDLGNSFVVPPLNDHVIYSGDVFMADLLDREWTDVDNTGGPYDGNLYLSAVYFGGALNTQGQLVLTKPAGSSGFDMSNIVTAIPHGPNGEFTQFVNLKVDQNGRVHLSCGYINPSNFSGSILHTASNDGGQTFSPPVQVGTGGLLFPNQDSPNIVVHNRENAAASLAVDGDNVYITWTDLVGPSSDISKAYFSYSNDGGQNFSPQFEFGNFLVDSIDVFHFFPTVAADSGLVSISWHVIDKISRASNYYLAKSSDFGASFDTVMVISDSPSSFGGGFFYGDYDSSAKSGCYTYSVWSDGRSGSPVVYVAKTQTCSSTWVGIATPELSPVSEAFKVSSIWPNPASNIINFKISLSGSETISCEIYDLQGNLIERNLEKTLPAGDHQIQLNVNQLSAGQYLIRIQGSRGLFASRILVKE